LLRCLYPGLGSLEAAEQIILISPTRNCPSITSAELAQAITVVSGFLAARSIRKATSIIEQGRNVLGSLQPGSDGTVFFRCPLNQDVFAGPIFQGWVD
jgi:hypothetical protein